MPSGCVRVVLLGVRLHVINHVCHDFFNQRNGLVTIDIHEHMELVVPLFHECPHVRRIIRGVPLRIWHRTVALCTRTTIGGFTHAIFVAGLF